MRIKITRHHGELVKAGYLDGREYEVGQVVSEALFRAGWAEPVRNAEPALDLVEAAGGAPTGRARGRRARP